MNRKGVVILFFDLPCKTKAERRLYSKFRKEILRRGYACLQESVYVKLLHNCSSSGGEIASVRALSPKHGSVMALPMPLAAFEELTALTGENFNFQLFAGDVLYV